MKEQEFSIRSLVSQDELELMTGYEDQLLTSVASDASSLLHLLRVFVTGRKQLLIANGPSGSGKSTIALMFKSIEGFEAIDLDEYGYHPSGDPTKWLIDVPSLMSAVRGIVRSGVKVVVIGTAQNVKTEVLPALRKLEYDKVEAIIVPTFALYATANDLKDSQSDHRSKRLHDIHDYCQTLLSYYEYLTPGIVLTVNDLPRVDTPTALPWVEYGVKDADKHGGSRSQWVSWLQQLVSEVWKMWDLVPSFKRHLMFRDKQTKRFQFFDFSFK